MLNEVADGVWVRQGAWVWSNAVVVRGDGGLILVDPGIDGAELDQLADDVDRLGMQALPEQLTRQQGHAGVRPIAAVMQQHGHGVDAGGYGHWEGAAGDGQRDVPAACRRPKVNLVCVDPPVHLVYCRLELLEPPLVLAVPAGDPFGRGQC